MAGLVVYLMKPPASWSLRQYNHPPTVRGLLHEQGHRNLTVPYRQNRATIFDSMLLHQSGEIQFKRGYKNRRINFTLLFGRKGDKCKQRRVRKR